MELKNKSDWLFKYTSFNLNAIKIFVNNKLWFGQPDIQNDLYELEFILTFEKKIKTNFELQFILNEELKNAIKKNNSGFKLSNGFERKEFELSLKKNVRDYIGICSMSEIFDDILMWSHYANSNKGICIVFKKNKLIKNLSVSLSEKVKYTDKMPQAKFKSDNENGYLLTDKDFFINKLDNWSDEEEFRFIKLFNPRIEQKDLIRLKYFPPNCIEGVIIGAKFSENDFETLSNLLLRQNNYLDIKFWKCEKNIYDKKMRIYQIKDFHQGKMDLILKHATKRVKPTK